MPKKLYVGNLSYQIDDQALGAKFSEFGSVASAKVITDRDSGRSKGFGFVEMENDSDADQAIEKLNGYELSGRAISVAEAKPQERTGGGGGGGFRRGPRPGGGGGGGSRGGFGRDR